MSKLKILQHSLGLDQYGQGRQHRNHFCTGPGSSDFETCMELVTSGYMTVRPPNALSGGGHIFSVTREGLEYVSANSPAHPKLTRSEKWYLAFLAEDCGLKFGEWQNTEVSPMIKPARGGKRPGAGRKPSAIGPLPRLISCKCTEAEHAEFLKRGGGPWLKKVLARLE